jgi:hypothetical protein
MTRENTCLAILAALWVLIGSYPLLLRVVYCHTQPLTEPCTITIRQ